MSMENKLDSNSLNGLLKSKWIKKVNDAIKEIKRSPSGNILISELEKYNFKINPKCIFSDKSTYSKVTFFENDIVRIILPLEEKFMKIRTIKKNSVNDSYDKTPSLHKKISINQEIKIDDLKEISLDKQSERISLIKFGIVEEQPFHTILANIFIHTIKHFLNLDNRLSDEYNHASIIHGLEGETLYLRDHKITENQIREELGLNYRVNAYDTYNI